MSADIRHHLRNVHFLATVDSDYCSMLQQVRLLEQKCDMILSSLPDDQRNILCDYLLLCESMSDRKLEIACAYMKFP